MNILDQRVVQHAVYEAASAAADQFPELQINVKSWTTREGLPAWTICPGDMAGYLVVKMSGTGAVMSWWHDIEQQLKMTKFFGPDEAADDVHSLVAKVLEAKVLEEKVFTL